ncbi:MAG TPA: UbiA family prenyltransferase [Pseudonocardiaceae bacterium]|nr:UbiA family prenyltransferase [Pseudonocardiaceae bacterium]
METATVVPDRKSLLRGLAGSCHPVPGGAVTVIAVLVAIGVGLGPAKVVLFGLAMAAGQLSIGWSNDRIDAGRDAANARKDKPAATGAVSLRAVTIAAGAGLLTSLVLSLTLGWRAALAMLVLDAAGWSYNLGLKSTVFSGLTYLVGPGLLPVVPYLALPGHPLPPWWASAAGALLGLGAHFANVLPDLRADEATGVRGLPHRLGARASIVVMALVLAAATLVVVLGPSGAPGTLGWIAVALAVALAAGSAVLGIRRPNSALAFYSSLAIAIIDVVVFIAAA